MSKMERHLHLTLRDISQINAGVEALDEALSAAGAPARLRHHHLLAVEEVVVNALKYSAGAISVGVTINATVEIGRVVTTIVYPGPYFDVSDPSKVKPIDSGRIGGHGLRLLHALAKEVDYTHADGINTITLSKTWAKAR